MDILKDRTIWIAIVVLALSGLYYWIVVDQNRLTEMENLETSDFELTGDVTEWSEAYKRLELKWRGTSKHVKTLQEETHSHYNKYNAKVDSISPNHMYYYLSIDLYYNPNKYKKFIMTDEDDPRRNKPKLIKYTYPKCLEKIFPVS